MTIDGDNFLKHFGTILFISTTGGAPWGGSEELWASAALELRRKDKRKVFANVKRWPYLPSRITEMQVAGVEFSFRNESHSLPRRIFRRLLGDEPYFRWHLQNVQPDFVIVSNGGNVPPTPLADSLLVSNIPFVNISHANGVNLLPSEHSIDILSSYFNRAVLNCFIAETHRHLLEQQLGAHIPNWRIVKNPVNLSRGAHWCPIDNDSVSKKARMAFVGSIDDNKGQDLLLDVLSKPKWKQRDWSLSMFGRGPREAALRRMVNFVGLDDRVKFKGHVTQISEIWLDHDLLVITSRSEGMPLSILEAMLCGRPVLATDVGDIARVVAEGSTGFLAGSATVKSIDETLERAWKRRAEWCQIGLNARDRALAFVPLNAGKDLLTVIDDFIS